MLRYPLLNLKKNEIADGKIYTGCANKKQSPRKKFYILAMGVLI